MLGKYLKISAVIVLGKRHAVGALIAKYLRFLAGINFARFVLRKLSSTKHRVQLTLGILAKSQTFPTLGQLLSRTAEPSPPSATNASRWAAERIGNMLCPVCLKECIEIKDDMAIHRYMDEWVANMCVISPRTIASQSFTDKFLECEAAVRRQTA